MFAKAWVTVPSTSNASSLVPKTNSSKRRSVDTASESVACYQLVGPYSGGLGDSLLCLKGYSESNQKIASSFVAKPFVVEKCCLGQNKPDQHGGRLETARQSQTGSRTAKRLTLAELNASPSTTETWFLSLFHSRISCQESAIS